ncbi:MAG: hypothetical protein COB02_03565 [Candidatus Cloacimonadota bacterium]|nr:MAG: hypothetical protein COB02_03565 [Candidatus Cloacimonadota bacterium]
MTKTNKIYLTFRSNLTKFVPICTFLLLFLITLSLLMTRGKSQIISIEQKVQCYKYQGKQKFNILIQNHSWIPQIKLLRLSGININSKIKTFIQQKSTFHTLLNKLQTNIYLDKKQSILIPIYLSSLQKVNLNIQQESPIQNSIKVPLLSLYLNDKRKIKRTIKFQLDKKYSNIKAQPNILNYLKKYKDQNQFKILLNWDYIQYFSISNFMG